MRAPAIDSNKTAIGYGGDGRLMVEEVAADDIVERFGTPSYVVSESQLRHNYRTFYKAFSSHYPRVAVAYGVKAHNGIAVAAVLAQEGCGAECFGLGEMTVSERAGIAPGKIWVNGSDKSEAELAKSIRNGYTINVDNPEELGRLIEFSSAAGRAAKVNLRVKLPLRELDGVTMKDYRYVPPEVRLSDWAREHKFGMSADQALECVKLALDSHSIELKGLHHHLKGQTSNAGYFYQFSRELAAFASELRDKTGWSPSELDLGGGFSYGRSEGYGPEGRDTEVPSLEEYASAMASALLDSCPEFSLELPTMVLEPGRCLVASASILLTTVGTVKRQTDNRTWVHVDSSINHVIRAYTGNWYYHIVSTLERPESRREIADVVGPLCDAADIIGKNRELPLVQRGDVLAVLDVGAYGESAASNFNTQPKPVAVMVRKSDVAVMTERETIEGMLSRQQLPNWL